MSLRQGGKRLDKWPFGRTPPVRGTYWLCKIGPFFFRIGIMTSLLFGSGELPPDKWSSSLIFSFSFCCCSSADATKGTTLSIEDSKQSDSDADWMNSFVLEMPKFRLRVFEEGSESFSFGYLEVWHRRVNPGIIFTWIQHFPTERNCFSINRMNDSFTGFWWLDINNKCEAFRRTMKLFDNQQSFWIMKKLLTAIELSDN